MSLDPMGVQAHEIIALPQENRYSFIVLGTRGTGNVASYMGGE
jgi:hypothetical protein